MLFPQNIDSVCMLIEHFITFDCVHLPNQPINIGLLLFLIQIQTGMNHGHLVAVLLILQLAHAQIIDTSALEQHGVSFATQPCSANTVIDFAFSSNSILTLAGTVANPSASTLRYLDVIGNQKIFTLVQGQLDTSNTFLTGFSKAFVFKYVSGSSTVFVAVPIIDNGATPSAEAQQTVSLSTVKDSPLQSLASYNSGATTIALSTFNFLNDITYGKFYSTMDKNTMTTLLVNKIHYKFTGTLTGVIGSLFVPASYTFTSSTTGDVLCWGSQYSTGFFQTHMRESVPLWTFLLFTFFFWLFNLLSAEVTPQVYERSFKDNKWTCWSLYSLYYLSHQQWFTRTARSSLLLMNFFWQCIVLSAIYNYQGIASDPSIIIWAAVVAYVASIPIPYLVGNVFFQRIYAIELEKFQTLHDLHIETRKEKHDELQRSAILKEEHIYGIFYFYYSACILLFIVFGILSVHLMQQFPRDFYHLHWYWLASAGIAFGLDHLLIDPIMTLLFGNRQFYRSRGYYYNGELGELARLAD